LNGSVSHTEYANSSCILFSFSLKGLTLLSSQWQFRLLHPQDRPQPLVPGRLQPLPL
jgi:hypothetical protein